MGTYFWVYEQDGTTVKKYGPYLAYSDALDICLSPGLFPLTARLIITEEFKEKEWKILKEHPIYIA
jgi:hypothetical protein